MTSPNIMTIEQLAQEMGRDVREIERLASKGHVPGRRVDGRWVFQSNEIREWIETELRTYTPGELTALEKSQHSQETDSERPVTSLLKRETIEVPLIARTKRSALGRLVEVANATWQIYMPDDVLNAVLEREDAMSTAMEGGVAIPHLRTPLPDALGESMIAFGRTASGIPFGGTRGLTDLFFLILCRDTRTHLQVLARLGRLFHLPGFFTELREAEDADAVWDIIWAAEESLD
ncbi:PTS sugar transporter subunit IIA [Rubinisphaera sp. JC750]|uniref:PTS sugar transporter subunit IIA n=1 Tax=Rubinisphaera sp. JC750 TaxID=2898658 RepID=UPI001F39B159|nr:PTS sugar transporter subunit IIA [Rubinisphaera sp. JC750]